VVGWASAALQRPKTAAAIAAEVLAAARSRSSG
jgi:hypothetical protein